MVSAPRLLEALADAPPQEVTARASTTLRMERDKAGLQRIPVRVGDTYRRFVFDTGAEFSTIMRSEAEELGLEIEEAGLQVKSAAGGPATAGAARAGGNAWRTWFF